jgi:hypothetical protein
VGFLRQIVPDSRDDPVRASAGELACMGTSIRGGRNTIGITIERDRWHSDHRACGKSSFQLVVLWFADSEAQPLAVVVNEDADAIRVVEGRSGAIQRGVIEVHVGELNFQISFAKSRRFAS